MELPNDAQASSSLDIDRRARVCLRESPVVEAAGLEEACDGGVDFVFRMLKVEQAVAALGDGERAPGQEMNRVDVGGGPPSGFTKE